MPSTHVPCAMCASSKTFRITGTATRDLLRCRACGVRFAWPQPAPEEREAFYRADYIPDDAAREWNFETQRKGALDRVARAVTEFTRGPRILDVGDAGGGFLNRFDPSAWTRSVVEPADVANDSRGEGIEAFPGLFPDAVPVDRRFDAITMLDLIMLLPDPVTALHAAHTHLDTAGTLAVEIPGNLFRMVLHVGPVPLVHSRRMTDLVLDVHLFLFDHRSICWLLDRTGFEIKRIVTLPASRVHDRTIDRALQAWSKITASTPFVRTGRPSIGPKYLYLAARR